MKLPNAVLAFKLLDGGGEGASHISEISEYSYRREIDQIRILQGNWHF